jgi:MFS family permease
VLNAVDTKQPVGFPSLRTAWWSVSAITVVFTIAFVHRIGLGLYVEPMKRSLGFSDTQIGLLTGLCFALPYTLGGLFCGWLADRANRVRLLRVSAFVWSAATAAIGLLGSFVQIGLARVMTGFGQAAVQPVSGSLLADLFEPNARGRAYGLFITGTAFGTAGAFLLGALSVSVGESIGPAMNVEAWRVGLLMLGALGLFALLALARVREPARQERSLDRPATLSELRTYCARHWVVLSTLFLGVTLTFLAPYGQLAFMPALFTRKYGWSADELATTYGLIAIVAGGGGSLFAGWLCDRLRQRGTRDSAWLLCLLGAPLSLIPAAAAPLAESAHTALLLYGIAGLFTNWPSVGVLAAVAELAPNELRGQINSGSTAMVGLLAGGLGPVVVGVLTDRVFSSEAALDKSLAWTFAGCAVAATVALALGWRAYRRAIADRDLNHRAPVSG